MKKFKGTALAMGALVLVLALFAAVAMAVGSMAGDILQHIPSL